MFEGLFSTLVYLIISLVADQSKQVWVALDQYCDKQQSEIEIFINYEYIQQPA